MPHSPLSFSLLGLVGVGLVISTHTATESPPDLGRGQLWCLLEFRRSSFSEDLKEVINKINAEPLNTIASERNIQSMEV